MEKIILKETGVDKLLEKSILLAQSINELQDAAESACLAIEKLHTVSFDCGDCGKTATLDEVAERGHSLCCELYMIAKVNK